MNDIANRISSLSPDKQALLALLLKKSGLEASLSFAQQRLWFLAQLEPGSSAYNMSAAVRLSGHLKPGVLAQCFSEIVRRHEVLRTRFVALEGRAVPLVDPPSPFTVPVIDLSEAAEGSREAEVRRYVAEEANRPFDLTLGPLLRATLLRLGAEEHVIMLTMHHIISDGWSIGVLVREMSALYEAFSTGKGLSLPPLPIQYGDYARWQRQWLQGEVLDAQLAYWKRQLGGNLPVLQLPTDSPRPAKPTYRGKQQEMTVPSGTVKALQTLSHQEGATLFMTLLAAFKVLLYRLTGQADIIAGVPVANRNRAEVEGLIGFFVNSLALRTDLSGNPAFRELMARVRAVCLGAYAHQDIPFDKLVEELHPERNLNRNPLFDLMFNMVNTPESVLELPGLSLSLWEPDEIEAKFPMTFYVHERGDELSVRVVYQAELFSEGRVAEMLHQFGCMLEQVAVNPTVPIDALSLVTPESLPVLPDPKRPLYEANYPLVTDLVSDWARRMPQQVALRYGEQVCTYGDLVKRANTLAKSLVASGQNRSDVVAVLGARSPGVIASMLAVFASGGVLLTIDPKLPLDRQRLMLEQAGAKYMLCVGDLPSEANGLALQVLEVNADTAAVEGFSVDGVALPDLRPEDPAYIFFTSGTTGVPKGVLGWHKALSHFLCWQRESFQVGPGDCCAQLTGLSFDVVLRDVFLPLVSGATLSIPTEPDELGADRIIRWLEREGVTTLHTVPALAQAWLSSLPSGWTVPSLRRVFFAGEPLTGAVVNRWRAVFPNADVVNLYGPTETTLAKFYYMVSGRAFDGVLPVGFPLPETQALVLNRNGRLCGIGEPGEIAIRTPYRSLGYINAANDSEKRFVANPFGTHERDLLYRTGDLGRYRTDGALEVLGRIDQQIKIRGVRVEPGEVAAALSQCPDLKEAIVMGRKDEHGNSFLAAYAVAMPGSNVTIQELQFFLSQSLPAVMIPSAYVFLEQLPLTANGKVDYRALPAPELARANLADAFAPARTPVEEILAGLLAQVLGVSEVGIHDNFFAMGGHSLLATQLMSRVRDAFQVDLPLRSLFEAPTVFGLASKIEAARSGPKMAVTQISRTAALYPRSLPLSFAQQRLWFQDQMEPGNPTYNIPKALWITGPLEPDVLRRTLEEIVGRHDSLRTTFAVIDGEPMQVIQSSGAVPWTMVDLCDRPEPARRSAALALASTEAEKPFDLKRGPLLRAQLIRVGHEEHLLLLTIHHIVADAWSMGILGEEISECYRAFSRGETPSLPPLPIQYGDFAVWQRDWFQGAVVESQMAYWKRQLAGMPAVLQLPVDRPRAAIRTLRGAKSSFALPESVTAGLKELSRREGVTLFMTLLAAFQTLLHRYSGQDDIVLGSPIANRTRKETEALIGFIVNTLLLRTDLSGNPRFRELVQRVREVALGAYAHQDLPFEKLVEALHPDRHLSYSPLFQVMFVLQNVPKRVASPTGMGMKPLDLENGTAKFDLTLTMSEGPEGLVGTVAYSTDLFDAATISRMIGHFQSLLQGVVTNPDERLMALQLLTATEREQFSRRGDRLGAEVPFVRFEKHEGEQSISARFGQIVRRHAHQIALKSRNHIWTYAQLNKRSNQVARGILACCSGQSHRVALLFGHDAPMVAGMLGVLKAGQVYVPLDPAHPAERLSYILADAETSVIVTDSEQMALATVLAGGKIPVINVDTLATSDSDLQMAIAPDALAYILYTSGSTGKPKGVLQNHRNVLHVARVYANSLHINGEDRLALLSSYAFDAAVMDIFGALLNGATLLPFSIKEQGLSRLARWMAEEQITIYHSTATVYRHFVTTLKGKDSLPSLRLVVLGGEPVYKRDFEQYREHFSPDCIFVNGLGPSESTLALQQFLNKESEIGGNNVPVGYPVEDTEILLLSETGEPIADYGQGEIAIRSRHVALGYWRQPQLTSEAFLPCENESGERIYRTGDLGCLRPDGSIEFRGRKDFQIKVRGHRIDAGEVESALLAAEGVKEAVVALVDDGHDGRLVAYVVPEADQPLKVSDVRAFMRRRLPEFMLPSLFVKLAALPLTTTGKVDRQALPTPEQVRPELSQDLIVPRNAIELQLVHMWEEMLGIEPVGVRDNFFELGGHSMLALRMLARIEKEYGAVPAAGMLFQQPTVEALALFLQQAGVGKPQSALVEIQPNGEKRPFFCVHPAGGTAFCYWSLSRYLGRDQPFYGIQSPGLEEQEEPLTEVEGMADHYIRLVRSIQPNGPYLLGGWSAGGVIALAMAKQLQAIGEQVDLLAMIDTYTAPAAQQDDAATLVRYFDQVPLSVDHLRQMPADDQLAYVLERVQKQDRLPANLSLAVARRLLHVTQTNRRAVRAYLREVQPYDGQIILFKAMEEHGSSPEPDLGWGRLAIGGVELHRIPGDHNTIVFEPNVQVLAEKLRDCIQAIDIRHVDGGGSCERALADPSARGSGTGR